MEVASTGIPTLITVANRSGAQKLTRISDRSSMLTMVDCVVTLSPILAATIPATPSIGATMSRRLRLSSAVLSASLADSSAICASITSRRETDFRFL
ncbi:hypothetical protein D3C78_1077880 [compost metagenome]